MVNLKAAISLCSFADSALIPIEGVRPRFHYGRKLDSTSGLHERIRRHTLRRNVAARTPVATARRTAKLRPDRRAGRLTPRARFAAAAEPSYHVMCGLPTVRA